MTSDFLIQELAKKHTSLSGWLFVPELRIGTGYGQYNEQRIDAWAIQAWKSFKGAGQAKAPHLRRAFEIKVSAADVLQELRNSDKRWMAHALSHEFYFVAPAGLISAKLLTKDDGLMEWTGTELRITKPPRVREGMPPRWDFVAAITRRIIERETQLSCIPGEPISVST